MSTDHTPAPAARPEPVLNPAKLGGLAGGAFTAVAGTVVLIAAGITAESIPAIGVAIGAAVTALAALAVYTVSVFAGKAGRSAVTPLSDPRTEDGRRLVPVEETGQVVAVATSTVHITDPDELARHAASSTRRALARTGGGRHQVVPQTPGVDDHAAPEH